MCISVWFWNKKKQTNTQTQRMEVSSVPGRKAENKIQYSRFLFYARFQFLWIQLYSHTWLNKAVLWRFSSILCYRVTIIVVYCSFQFLRSYIFELSASAEVLFLATHQMGRIVLVRTFSALDGSLHRLSRCFSFVLFPFWRFEPKFSTFQRLSLLISGYAQQNGTKCTKLVWLRAYNFPCSELEANIKLIQ